ncbi:MAG: riboflavin synthase, partial [Desulfuromonadales bacterium]|nr:riboflavin synthase [Desulfuromonadales bacterium]
KCSGLGDLPQGAKVNLERALRLSDRLGGHLVTGHVDGRARLIEKRREGNAWLLRFQADAAILKFLVDKGSVTVDGVSLTVNTVSAESFSLMIIPHTLEQTTLQQRCVGDSVNIETDLIGKYVAKFVRGGQAESGSEVTMDLLAKHGFL